MEIKEKDGNVVTIYELLYDEAKVRELMAKIARDCFIRKRGIFFKLSDESWEPMLYAYNKEMALKLIDGAMNHAGNHLYIDIDESNISLTKPEGWKKGDPYKVSFVATMTILPQLYSLLESIVVEDVNFEHSYVSLKEYKNSLEYLSYEERKSIFFKKLQFLVNDTESLDSNLNNMMSMIVKLKELNEEMSMNKDYDFDKLRGYYEEAVDLFSLRVIRRTELIEDGGVIKLSSRTAKK